VDDSCTWRDDPEDVVVADQDHELVRPPAQDGREPLSRVEREVAADPEVEEGHWW
jgi:hypothetical protein